MEVFLKHFPCHSQARAKENKRKNGQQKRWAHKKGNRRKSQCAPEEITVVDILNSP